MKSSVSFNSFITIRLCFGQHFQNNNCILGHNDMYLFSPREEHCCCLAHTFNLEVFFLHRAKYRSLSMKGSKLFHTCTQAMESSMIAL